METKKISKNSTTKKKKKKKKKKNARKPNDSIQGKSKSGLTSLTFSQLWKSILHKLFKYKINRDFSKSWDQRNW